MLATGRVALVVGVARLVGLTGLTELTRLLVGLAWLTELVGLSWLVGLVGLTWPGWSDPLLPLGITGEPLSPASGPSGPLCPVLRAGRVEMPPARTMPPPAA